MIPGPILALWSMLRGSWAGRLAAALVAAGIVGRIIYWRGARAGRKDARAEIAAHERERTDAMHDRVDAAWGDALARPGDADQQLQRHGRLRDGE